MKVTELISSKALLVIVVLLLLIGSNAFAQTGTSSRKMTTEGDSVWVIVNHIKPDKRQQFEKFIYEIFWPGSAKLDPKVRRAFEHTRVLNPSGPDKDGTYAYVFLMDPLINGLDYEIDNLLKLMFPKDKAEAYSKMMAETLARDQDQYMVVQSKLRGAAASK